MCNLSKGVEEKGIQKGILLSIRNLMEKMRCSVEQAMERGENFWRRKEQKFRWIRKYKSTKYINFENSEVSSVLAAPFIVWYG